jgi:hypothetical protein
MTLIWICIAYEAHEQKMSRRRARAIEESTLTAANQEV